MKKSYWLTRYKDSVITSNSATGKSIFVTTEPDSNRVFVSSNLEVGDTLKADKGVATSTIWTNDLKGLLIKNAEPRFGGSYVSIIESPKPIFQLIFSDPSSPKRTFTEKWDDDNVFRITAGDSATGTSVGFGLDATGQQILVPSVLHAQNLFVTDSGVTTNTLKPLSGVTINFPTSGITVSGQSFFNSPIDVTGRTTTLQFKLPTGASNGYILQSDA